MPACGYAWPWRVRAGEHVALHASCADPAATVSVRRLDFSGNDPDWPIRHAAPLGHRAIVHGSWIEIGGLGPSDGATLGLEFLLTRNATPRTLIAWGGVSVDVDPEGRLTLATTLTPDEGFFLQAGRWLTLALSWDAAAVRLIVRTISGREIASLHLNGRPATSDPKLLLGRGAAGPAANWRLGRIAYGRGNAAWRWQFPTRGPVDTVAADDPHGPALRVFNDPTFACTSARWDGRVDDPRLAPDQYDAIHLHEDDVGALDWPATHWVDIPADAPSGVYAFAIATEAGTEEVAFFVRPAKPRAALAILLPTLTYAAYADEALPPERFPWVCDDRSHRFARANGLLSLYDAHADGSGVSMKCLRHPKSTLRSDYRYPLSGSPHLLSVDLDLLAFCHAQNIAFDLLTDGDLHAEGVAALAPYAGLAIASHPEYWTGPMQAALRGWLDAGGNLVHLGGNGFMWVTGFDGERVEVRRGRTLAARTWDGAPGEITMALDAMPGGLWRERGRPEFAVVGTGMTMMGFGPARPYRRCDGHPAWDWVFAAVPPGPIGASGRVLGGAAGYEVDRADPRLGTPQNTVVLAVADGFGPQYETDANEYFAGGAPDRAAARRADLAARRDEGGGFVVSVGSVAWCAALPLDGTTNAVGAITANLLRAAGVAR